jgi:hypothetical protein
MSQFDASKKPVIDPPERSRLNDPQHWRDRAQHVLTIAKEIEDGAAREMMMAVAESYEHLARRAEERLRMN